MDLERDLILMEKLGESQGKEQAPLRPVCDVKWKAQERDAGCWSKIDLTIDAI